MNEFKKEGFEEETKPDRDAVELGVCEDTNWAGGKVVVVVGCPSDAAVVGGAFDIFFGRNDFEKLDKGKLSGNIVCGDAGMLCKAEERDELGDLDNGGRV